MRREGKPHGMVRTYHVLPSPLNPKPSSSRIINKIDSPPTAGLFTKISQKPTNHSKFTGKCDKVRCSGCHLHPANKAKDKTKGVQKIKTADAAFSYQQITMGVTGSGSGLGSSSSSIKLRNNGYSASGILDQLNIFHNHLHDHGDDDYDYDDDDGDYDGYDDDDVGDETNNVNVEQAKKEVLVENDGNNNGDDGNYGDDGNDDYVDDDVIIHAGVTDDGDDGYVGFYDVGYVVNSVDDDDEGWSVVRVN